MIFTLDSVHRMPQKIVNQQNMYVLIMKYCCNEFFIHTLSFLGSLSFTKNEYIFGFNQTNSLIASHAVFLFS